MIRLLACAVAILSASAASARPGTHLRGEAIAVAPLFTGVRLAAETPGRLRLSTAVGVLPRTWVRSINGIAEAFGAYDAEVGEVIEESLSSSLVFRAHVGWRPFADAGFYLEAGYGLVALGGGTTEGRVLSLAFDLDGREGGARYDVRATLHAIDGEAGWEWWIADRLSLRLGLGVTSTLGARSTIDRKDPSVLGDRLADRAERALVRIAERYVHTPTVAFAIGWRFL